MKRVAFSLPATVAVVGLVIAACGGKVDESGFFGSDPSGSSSGSNGNGSGRRPGGGGTGTRPVPLVSVEALAANIAEDYCKAFSSCCVGDGQPPIDVSRCRTLITQQLQTFFGTSVANGDPTAADSCIATIRERVQVCGTEDVAWSQLAGSKLPGLLAPSSVQLACGPLSGTTGGGGGGAQPCSPKQPCQGSETCAIDECSADPGPRATCPMGRCLDSLECLDATCAIGPNLDVGAACKTDAECMLGLVCTTPDADAGASGCQPAREHPDLYKERSSPYRIDADTCKAWQYL